MTTTVHMDHTRAFSVRMGKRRRREATWTLRLQSCSAPQQPAARHNSRGLRTRTSVPRASAAHAHSAGRERSWACVGARARAAGARTTAVGSVRALTCWAPCWRAGGSGSGRFSLCPSRSVSRFPPAPFGTPLPDRRRVAECLRGRGRASGGRGRAPRPPGRRPREAPAARDSAAPWTSRGCRRR